MSNLFKKIKTNTIQKWINNSDKDTRKQFVEQKKTKKSGIEKKNSKKNKQQPLSSIPKLPKVKKNGSLSTTVTTTTTTTTTKKTQKVRFSQPHTVHPTVIINGKIRELKLKDDIEVTSSSSSSPSSDPVLSTTTTVSSTNSLVERDCAVCDMFDGWWCRGCFHYVIKKQLINVEFYTESQAWRLLEICKGAHPNLVPCFSCNRNGQKNKDLPCKVKMHESFTKDQDFWQKLLFVIMTTFTDRFWMNRDAV